MREFENPNIFQSDDDYNIYDAGAKDAIQIRCPHCQAQGTFLPALNQSIGYAKQFKNESKSRMWAIFAHIRVCPNLDCKSIVFTITSHGGNEKANMCFPPETLNFNPENIPKALKRTLEEAISCHSLGAFRACAMMVRRLLEELCDDCGATGKTLHARLKDLRSQITLSEELFDAMDELKALGNDAAHIEAKAFANIDKEEAELSIELAQEILKARYQHKSLVDRLRSRKKTPN